MPTRPDGKTFTTKLFGPSEEWRQDGRRRAIPPCSFQTALGVRTVGFVRILYKLFAQVPRRFSDSRACQALDEQVFQALRLMLSNVPVRNWLGLGLHRQSLGRSRARSGWSRTHLGLEKGTPDGRIRSITCGQAFHTGDSVDCTIVTIERPSPDRLSAYPYIYVSSTHWGSYPPESSCGIESIIVFRTTLPRTAVSWSRLKFWRTTR
jgi:hypothetical protein